MLAMAITIMLLVAVYVAMDVLIGQMDAGRTVIQQTSLARALTARISDDLTASVGPIVPQSGGSSSGSGGAGAGATTPAASTTTTTTATSSATVLFQMGVKGDSNHLAIYRTRLSRDLITPPTDASGNMPPVNADVWRVCYFIAQQGGLARQDIQQATADAVDDLPTDADEFTKILATEVESLEFRYYDGTNWQDSWDGSTPGPDGVTPQGPPRSVEVTLGIRQGDVVKTFKHVIAFPTAPGPSSKSQ